MSWVPLEANPDVMNKYIAKLGVETSKLSFQEIIALEEWGMPLDRPCYAVLLLYPLSPKYREHGKKVDDDMVKKKIKSSSDVFFMKQFVGNACGTIGIMHSLVNVGLQHGAISRNKTTTTDEETTGIKDIPKEKTEKTTKTTPTSLVGIFNEDSFFPQFFKHTEGMNATAIGEAMLPSKTDNRKADGSDTNSSEAKLQGLLEKVTGAHEASANEGQSAVTEEVMKTQDHFIAFVLGPRPKVMEKDGIIDFDSFTNNGGVSSTTNSSSDSSNAASSSSSDSTSKEISSEKNQMCIYELDGRRDQPVPHAFSSEKTFLLDCAKVIKKFMQVDPTQIRFSMLALCGPPSSTT